MCSHTSCWQLNGGRLDRPPAAAWRKGRCPQMEISLPLTLPQMEPITTIPLCFSAACPPPHHHHTPCSCIISAFTRLTGSLSGNTVLPESQSEAACDERRRRPTSSPRGCRCAESTRRSTGPLKTECKLRVSGCVCVCVCLH